MQPNPPATWPPFTPGPAAQQQSHHHDDDDDWAVNLGVGNSVYVPGYGYEGYYYPDYSSYYDPGYTYPSIYSYYDGFPSYVTNPGIVIVPQTGYPGYDTPYQPFSSVSYAQNNNNYGSVTVNNNGASSTKSSADADQTAPESPDVAQADTAVPDDSYTAAFRDIEHAWAAGDIALIRKHLREDDSKVAVMLGGKYKYSLDSADYEQVTRDAVEKVATQYFKFDRLRKSKTGDVTAFGIHIYRTAGDAAVSDTATVPFDTAASPSDKQASQTVTIKTVYVAYTLRNNDGQWYITGVDSSTAPLVPEQAAGATKH